MSSQRQLVLGLFFIATLSVLAFYTLFLTDLSLFGERQELRVNFANGSGLRQGDAVLVAGLRVGRVTELDYDHEAPLGQQISVTLRLSKPISLYEGYEIAIRESTFLGGKQVEITPGEGAAPPIDMASVDVFSGVVGSSPMKALEVLGETFVRNQDSIDQFLQDLAGVAAALRGTEGTLGRLINDVELGQEVADSLVAFRTTMDNAAELTTAVVEGDGTLHRLVYDGELYETAQSFLANLDTASEALVELREDSGPLARLLHDSALGDEIDETIRTIGDIADQVANGPGTVHSLLYEDELVTNLTEFSENLNKPDGTIGLLLNEREFYDRLLAISEDVERVSSALAEAEGTLGKLIMDDELYDDVLISVRLLNRSLEDFREAAPIQAFTSVLFSAF